MAMLDRSERICGQDGDERAPPIGLLAQLRARVPCPAYVWLLTDPQTCVGSAPMAESHSLADLPMLIRLKHLTATNRWTCLSADSKVTLVESTAGARSKSRVWAELLSGYGVDDVVSTVFRDQQRCWGFVDLWRCSGAFTGQERELLDRRGKVVTPALRRSQARTFALSASSELRAWREPVV